jgi:integrase
MITIQKVAKTTYSMRQEPDGQGIPFRLVRELFLIVEYGSICSVGIKLLHYTGCRIAELDNMQRSKICDGYIYWECGKNQHGWRKEYLPADFIAELEYYWKRNRMPIDNVLGVSSDTFTRYFRKYVRPKLSIEWHEHRVVVNDDKLEDIYKYALKGFRKNFATLLFCYFWRKYNDAYVAVERVSKRMRHSSKHITVNHYIETVEQIEAEKYMNLMPFEIIEQVVQTRLYDFCQDPRNDIIC